jgi:hypothetical protein
MEQNGIPVKYIFADDFGQNTDISVIHTTKLPVTINGERPPKFEVHSSTSKQTFKNKILVDESNNIVASSLRMGGGTVMMIPEPPKKGDVSLVLSNGKVAWKNTNDDRVNNLINSVDNMLAGLSRAVEGVQTRLDQIDKRIDDICSKVDKRFEEFEEMVDVDTNRANMARLRSEVSTIMDLIDGFAVDDHEGVGTPMTAKLAKNIIADSNPTFSDGRVIVKGRVVDIIGALCRLASNNNMITKKASE